jgi:hypothetical protein
MTSVDAIHLVDKQLPHVAAQRIWDKEHAAFDGGCVVSERVELLKAPRGIPGPAPHKGVNFFRVRRPHPR